MSWHWRGREDSTPRSVTRSGFFQWGCSSLSLHRTAQWKCPCPGQRLGPETSLRVLPTQPSPRFCESMGRCSSPDFPHSWRGEMQIHCLPQKPQREQSLSHLPRSERTFDTNSKPKPAKALSFLQPSQVLAEIFPATSPGRSGL